VRAALRNKHIGSVFAQQWGQQQRWKGVQPGAKRHHRIYSRGAIARREATIKEKTPEQLIRGLINRTTLANSTTAAVGHYAHVLSAHFNCEALFMTTWPTIYEGECEIASAREGAAALN
jgi:hypothetical protein